MNFILQEFITDISICDRLIDFHTTTDIKGPGLAGNKVNTDVKASTDALLTVDNELFFEYTKQLQKVVDSYIKEYIFADNYAPWTILNGANIQHYKPNEGFFKWHTERNSADLSCCNRHLVFMTYLNDVDDGGETEFYYQELKIKPEKGKTVIFPADWTHTHRGITSPTQDKYIITGWFDFTR